MLLAAGVWFIIDGERGYSHDQWLIRDGLKIDAKITVAAADTLPNRIKPADSIVTIEFPWKAGSYSPHARPLEGRKQGDSIITGTTLPIHVNPDNPEDWTWLDTPLPFLTRMIGAWVAAPLMAITIFLMR